MPFLDRGKSQKLEYSKLDFEDDGMVVSFLEGLWEDRAQKRQALERQWYISVAYYLGFQYMEWSTETRELTLPEAPPWRVRLVVNRLQGIVRTNVARFLKQKPTWTVLPATNDESDYMVARTSEKILTYYWRHLNMTQKLVDLISWMGITGNAFLHVGWDSESGSEMEFSAEEVGEEEPVRVGDGDVFVEVLSPFEVDVDPAATSLDDAEWVVRSKLRSLSYIRDRYGVEIPGETTAEESLSRYYLDRIASFAGPTGFSGTGDYTEERLKEAVIEHTLWINPCKKYPHGATIVVAGKQVMPDTRQTDLGGLQRAPISHFEEIAVPGRLWGTCALEQCIHLQQNYNRTRSQVIENKNLMSRPKWMVPKGSGVPDTSLTSEPGEIITYNYPLKPDMVQPVQIPEYVHKDLEYTLRDLQDVSAQRDATQARMPSGARSGVAIAQLQEQDDSMIAPALLRAEEELARTGADLLRLLRRNVVAPRLVKITGADQMVDTLAFTGDLIVGETSASGANYFDVEVQMGSQLPMSKAARTEFIIQLVQFKILDPERHRGLILKMLDLGTEEPAMHESQLDQNAVHRENILMLQGMDVAINDWDNDPVHMEGHRKFQKSSEYEQAARRNPMLNEIFNAHMALHTQRQQMAEQISQGRMPDQVDRRMGVDVPDREGEEQDAVEQLQPQQAARR